MYVNLPEVDGFNHLVVCIDYFTKWSEAKPVRDKTAPTIAQFLYEIICRHGCMNIQINGQGREFVNKVSEVLHKMTGTEQRITSSYHPQSNGLCERQNRIIKDSLVKVLDEKPVIGPTSLKEFYLHIGLASTHQRNFPHFSFCIIGSQTCQSILNIT